MHPIDSQIVARQLQHRVQRTCPSRPRGARRPRPDDGRAPYPIGDPLGLSFGAARRAQPALEQALVEAGAGLSALGTSAALLRDFLLAAAAPGATAEHVADGARALGSAAFARLTPGLARSFVDTYRRLADGPELRRALLSLLEEGALAVLPPAQADELLRYLAGPSPGPSSEPGRARALLGFWSRQATWIGALAQALARAADPATTLARFLHLPASKVHVLRSARRAGCSVVFGAVDDRKSLSYVQRMPRGCAHLALQSPDPSVASGWARGMPRADEELECRSVMLTRAESLALIQWMEHSHAVSRERAFRPRQLPAALFRGALALDRSVEAVVRALTAGRDGARFERSLVLAGRERRPPHQSPTGRGGA